VAILFYGRYEHKIDSKGRIQIPVAIRKAGINTVYSEFMLLRGPDNCLALVPEDDFIKNFDSFRPETLKKGESAKIMRRLYPNAFKLPLDNQGRILLPKNLRDIAGIESDALIIGVGAWIEIWNKDRYEMVCDDSKVGYDEIADLFFSTLGRKKPDENNDV
jgi:MraZ protein